MTVSIPHYLFQAFVTQETSCFCMQKTELTSTDHWYPGNEMWELHWEEEVPHWVPVVGHLGTPCHTQWQFT